MIKQFFKISFYSFVAFCTVNFTHLIYSIIHNKISGYFPNFSFGFPFEIYHQFEVRSFENCYELQHGTFPENLIYNYVIFWIIIFFYIQFKKLKNNNLTNKND